MARNAAAVGTLSMYTGGLCHLVANHPQPPGSKPKSWDVLVWFCCGCGEMWESFHQSPIQKTMSAPVRAVETQVATAYFGMQRHTTAGNRDAD